MGQSGGGHARRIMARLFILVFFEIILCVLGFWGTNQPWRKLQYTSWTQEVYDELKDEIQTFELTKGAGIDYVNVLLIGEISAGKSSFFNSVESVFTGRVTTRAGVGLSDGSLTTQYRKYLITARDKKNTPIKFKFCDSMGLEGGDVGLSAKDFGKIMDGHVEELAELTGRGLKPGDMGYNESPTDNDRIHCVCFVISASAVSVMDDEVLDKFNAIREEAKRRNLYPLVILTKVDQICDDTQEVFNSIEVFEKVKEVGNKFGINLNQIFPVRNYVDEFECVLETDILTLQALRQILRNSEDSLKDVFQRREAATMNANRGKPWQAELNRGAYREALRRKGQDEL